LALQLISFDNVIKEWDLLSSESASETLMAVGRPWPADANGQALSHGTEGFGPAESS
jgi:hypothetical protein